jgi:hypothetical protein
MSEFDAAVQILDDIVTGYYGDIVTYIPMIGNSFDITAILSSPSLREETAPEATLSDCFVRLSEFIDQEPPRPGDAIQAGCAHYRIFDIRADWGRGYKFSLQKTF